jgi:hypothetical protein
VAGQTGFSKPFSFGSEDLMHATVQKLNLNLPYCDAKTATDILVVFRPPTSPALRLGDVLDVNLFQLDCEQTIHNVSRGFSFQAVIKSNDIHDLRMNGGHGTSRFPSAERRLELPATRNEPHST